MTALRLFLALSLAGTAACGILDPEIQDFGNVAFLEIEGGCWVIDTDEERYFPLLLPVELRVDGLRVQFEAETRPEVATFCPGVPIDLVFIEAVVGGGAQE